MKSIPFFASARLGVSLKTLKLSCIGVASYSESRIFDSEDSVTIGKYALHVDSSSVSV